MASINMALNNPLALTYCMLSLTTEFFKLYLSFAFRSPEWHCQVINVGFCSKISSNWKAVFSGVIKFGSQSSCWKFDNIIPNHQGRPSPPVLGDPLSFFNKKFMSRQRKPSFVPGPLGVGPGALWEPYKLEVHPWLSAKVWTMYEVLQRWFFWRNSLQEYVAMAF